MTLKICSKCDIEKSIEQFSKARRETDGFQDRCKACFKIYQKQRYIDKKHQINESNRLSYQANKKVRIAKTTEYQRNRKAKDPIYRLICNIRRRTNRALKASKWQKNNIFNAYIGCSRNELIAHLEARFEIGMNWDNYGDQIGNWSLDHIIPLSYGINEQELYKLCHFTNLRPLWHIQNLIKSNKIGV